MITGISRPGCRTAPWTAAVDLIAMDDPSKASQHWAGLGRVALHRPCGLCRGANPRASILPILLTRLALRSRRKDRLRTRMHAPSQRTWRSRTPCGAGRISPRRLRIRRAHALSGGLRAARRGDALQQHRCLQRECGGAALSAPGARRPAVAALILDRCRRPIPRLCVRYHAHLCRRTRPLCRPGGGHGPGAASSVR